MKPQIAALAVTSIVATAGHVDAAQDFAQSVWTNVDFLDQSSRLATTRSRNKKVRAFAQSEASEQTVFANALVAWMDGKVAGQAVEAPAGGSPRVGSLIAAPFRVASKVTTGVADTIDGVQTGRSVAVDTEDAGRQVTLPEIKLSHDNPNLKKLSSLSGAQFDAFYLTTQRDALLQLSTSYASYLQDGSDMALKALATRALPIVNRRLEMLKAVK